jgi:hypothetical protein
MRQAQAKGVENWQANLAIDEEGVSLMENFKLKMSR